MNQPHDLHVQFYIDLLKRAFATDAQLIIFDRFYLTQAFRSHATLSEYTEVEDLLAKHQALTVFLQVDETAIASRAQRAAEHRDKSWGEYIKTKGQTYDEIADYYIAQQRNQLTLLKQSKIPSRIFNTTEHGYDNIAEQLIAEWFN